MSEPDSQVDERLADFGARTAAIGARAGFALRVMQRLEQEFGWRVELVRLSRGLLPVAALLAVLGVAWAATTARHSEAELAAADIGTELEW